MRGAWFGSIWFRVEIGAAVKLGVPETATNFLTSWGHFGYSWTLLHGVRCLSLNKETAYKRILRRGDAIPIRDLGRCLGKVKYCFCNRIKCL
jgi:hypothetical protein